MNSLIGFTLIYGGTLAEIKQASLAQQRVLTPFCHLTQKTIKVGESQLTVWGHSDLNLHLHRLIDNSLVALVGSPIGNFSWTDVEETLLEISRSADFNISWDGRIILLKISADGKKWTMWNDWMGSIPVFHASLEQGRIASTLEPVIVSAAGLTAANIFIPGLISLLINGHFLSDWTLFKHMKVIPPDCVAEWDNQSFYYKTLWTIEPSKERWETGWDELVDEMYELSCKAINDVLKTQPSWILPLSSGLDSRLIAAVGAEMGVNMYTYTWGQPQTTDVIYARQIANVLDLPWKHIDLGIGYLAKYTNLWANCFGSSIHFHGMYQMSFLNALEKEPVGPILSGYLGDVLSDISLMNRAPVGKYQIYRNDWSHWTVHELKMLMKIPINDALEEIATELKKQVDILPGSHFQKASFLELWSRQRFFTNFQSTLCDFWRGVATPFLNRDYARFSMSCPRVAMDDKRLLKDMYRRYYGPMAVIPGTYGDEPLIRTGSFLLKRRISKFLPEALRRGHLRGFERVPLTMDLDCVQSTGRISLWPIDDAWNNLAEWVDVGQLAKIYDVAIDGNSMKPIRKLQSIQALAYRLLDT